MDVFPAPLYIFTNMSPPTTLSSEEFSPLVIVSVGLIIPKSSTSKVRILLK